MVDQSLLGDHRAWRESTLPAPKTPSVYTPVLISHGKFPYHGDMMYGAKLLAHPDKVHQHFDALESQPMWLYKSYIATDYVVKANLPDNGRWITVHPNGENESGHAVYIVPNPDGTHTVVAGAGGKLNGLQMSGVRDEGSYAQESAQKSKLEREQSRIQRQQMIEEQGQAAYEEMGQHLEASKSRRQSEKIEQGKSFVQAVLEAQGINANKVLEIPDSAVAGLDGARRTQVEVAHVRGLVSYARGVVKGVRERVLTALETASPEVGDVEYADLIREVISPKHPGYSVSPQQMAVERGLMPTPDALEALSDESRLLRSDGDVESAARAKAFVEKLQAGAEKARDQVKNSLKQSASYGSGPLAAFADTAKPVELQDAVKLLAMEKSLRDLDKTHKQEIAQETQGNLNGLTRPLSTPHAPISISEGADPSDVATSLMEDLRSRSVARLLDGVNTLEDAQGSLYGHYVRSRHETLSAIVGSHLPGVHVDPMLVDLLGGENGARLLVGALASQSSPEEMESFKEYVKVLHVKTQKTIADHALESAEPLITEGSKPIEADLHSPESVLLAYAQTQKQRGLIAKAQKHLGQAKGQIEAGASLNAAMMRQGKKDMSVVLPMDIKDAAVSCAGILGHYGLALGTDYTIVSPKSGETSLKITQEGVAKLTPKVSKALASRIEAIHAPAPTDVPVGFRSEIDAKSPLHEVANTGTGDLSPGDIGILRRYWADAQGMPSDTEPLNPLSKAETAVFKHWQDISTSGRGYHGLPGVLEAQGSLKGLPGLGSTDLDDPKQVLSFAHLHADALGYERVGDEILGLTNATPRKAFKDARKRIGRLVRGIWSHQQGAPEFDPESVPTASKLWTQAVRQQGFGRLVGTIQSQMLQDPRVTEGSGKAFRLTEGQQKARQLIGDNRRMNLAIGAGGGKTNTLFAAFLDAKKLHQDTQGRAGASRALMLVPSAVQGQFGSEWDRFISPEHEVTVFAKPGAGEEDRHSALAGDDVVVMTPESWRDTMTKALAQHRGETPQQTAQWAQSAPYQEVDSHVHAVMDNLGWNFGMVAVDEGHRLLGRQGKADSLMGILADSAARKRTESGELPYYIGASGDMAKNDPSEVYSGLSKVDPETYPPTPEGMDAWTRRYRGANGELSENAGLAMRMEAMPYTYTNKVDLPIKVDDRDVIVPLTPQEQGEHDEVMSAYKLAKSAVAGGKRDARAEQILGTDDPRLFALARDQRIGQVTSLSPQGGRMTHLKEKLGDGVPSIVFATSREAISMMERELNRAGHRVKTLTGSDSGLRKKKIADAFQRGEFDILLASDAAEAGVNLQRAQRVINYNVPMTEKTRAQRIARAARMGQLNDVEVENLVADCEGDRKNLARVKRKGGLREIMTTPLELADEDGHKFFKFASDVLKGGTTDEAKA